MKSRLPGAIATTILLLTSAACARKQAQIPPAPAPKQNLFVLLPEADGKVGGIVVSNSAGSQEIRQANMAVRVERADVAPAAPVQMSQQDVQRVFGSALTALPAEQLSSLLYFDEGRDELTAQSTASLTALVASIRDRKSTDVSVVGHTDTTGTSSSNNQLGLRRAQRVADILKSMGIDAAVLSIESHGETDLLVRTADGVAEPRNRRVEVIVR
jgi:outer membrane protein OmpA-like peptidoglycan-associated protein